MVRLLIVFIIWVVVPLPAQAQGVDIPVRRNSFTPGELAILPPYCANIMGFPGYEGLPGDRWRALLGSDFQHFHHYCRGLRDVYFARSAVIPAAQRRFLWERSINEYDYMIRNSSPTMALMPEIHLKKGESFVALGRLAEAQAAFEASRQLKPDYWPAYTRWIDELLKAKQFSAALALAEEGLQHVPFHPELLARLYKAKDGAGVPKP